ncbi:uncharacterized protein FIBRA_04858 [Fibroporia radiculosa]|uniref:DUF6534 domain-containing protein n=1 Tax=Fibroporia radiculosa TaxID=599839 RepID=J4GPY1_9APHY|nr:uncharacterized protein FIBRA_04858 [Fibroporia radiculosa]CCM02750.1 predicted protein [Fibroporia radiculosa]
MAGRACDLANAEITIGHAQGCTAWTRMSENSPSRDLIWGPVLMQGLTQYLFQGQFPPTSRCHIYTGNTPSTRLFLSVYIEMLKNALTTFRLSSFTSVPLTIPNCLSFMSLTAIESYKVWLNFVDQIVFWRSPLHSAEFFINGFICTLCEAFLLMQCWKLTRRNWWVLSFLTVLTTVTFFANIAMTVKIAQVSGDVFARNPLKVSRWAFPIWVYGSLALSLSLTIILSFCLWRQRTGVEYLDKTITYVITITWQSAALPCVCMLVGAVLVATEPRGAANLSILFLVSTGKLFTMGILSTLNSRVAVRKRISIQLGHPSWSDGPQFATGQSQTGEGTAFTTEVGQRSLNSRFRFHRWNRTIDPEAAANQGSQISRTSSGLTIAPPTRPPEALIT